MKLKIAAILFVFLSLAMVDQSDAFFRSLRKFGRKVYSGVRRFHNRHKDKLWYKVGKSVVKTASKHYFGRWRDGEELEALRELRQQDETAYNALLDQLTKDFEEMFGPQIAQDWVDFTDHIATMSDDDFKEFNAEEQLEDHHPFDKLD